MDLLERILFQLCVIILKISFLMKHHNFWSFSTIGKLVCKKNGHFKLQSNFSITFESVYIYNTEDIINFFNSCCFVSLIPEYIYIYIYIYIDYIYVYYIYLYYKNYILYIYNEQIFCINIKKWLGENIWVQQSDTTPDIIEIIGTLFFFKKDPFWRI